jgi:hypothetical protein
MGATLSPSAYARWHIGALPALFLQKNGLFKAHFKREMAKSDIESLLGLPEV